jgi:cell division protein FtsW (lipid II flippase)
MLLALTLMGVALFIQGEPMKIIFITIGVTAISIILFLALVIAIYKAIKVIKGFVNRNNELDKIDK